MKKTVWLGLLLAAILLAALSAAPVYGQNRAEKVPVFIGFTHQPGPAEEALVRGAGGDIKYTYHLVPAIAVSLPEGAIQGLLNNPNVTAIEPDIEVHAVVHPTGDPELDSGWGVAHIGSGVVHASGNSGTGVKLAIIDSGIDYNHPDLAANFAGGHDFFNSDTDPMDDNGHGTHVAGTVAAANNDIGVVGVAPLAKLYALKVLGANGSGSYSSVIAALQWAVDNLIQVTNNSYGSSGDPGTIVKAAFDNSYAAGVLHAAAAGNAGNVAGKGDNCIYPARWASVVAVGATNEDNTKASFSSTCPELELAAPGYQVNSTKLGGGYVKFSGTSMASPHVSGTAALVIATGITDTNGNGKINDEVRQRLTDTADDLGPTGRDTKYGYGLVNAARAAPAPPAPSPLGITTTSLPGGTVGVAYSATLQASGGTAPYTWAVTVGVLPAGLSLNTATGEISGTPTKAETQTFTVTVTDSATPAATASKELSITVAAPPPLGITTTSLPGGTVGVAYSATLQASSGTAPYTWAVTVGALPAGLSLNTATGEISGTPTTAGTQTFTATVTDSATPAATASKELSITVAAPASTSLSVSVTTDKASYVHAETAIITVTVTDGVTAVGGAAVSVTVTTANGNKLSGTGTTNDAGVAQFRAKVNTKRDGCSPPDYLVEATATKAGYNPGSGSTTFTASCTGGSGPGKGN